MRKATTAIALVLLVALSACKTENNDNTATGVAGATYDADAMSGQAQASGGEGSTAVSTPIGYTMNEGNSFYYQGDNSAKLIEVIDTGWAREDDGTFTRVLVTDGAKMTLRNGSGIVRVYSMTVYTNGMLVTGDSTPYPLDGDTIAAIAMRDAIGGNLTHPANAPTEAEWREKQAIAKAASDARIAASDREYQAKAARAFAAAEAEASGAADAAEAATQ